MLEKNEIMSLVESHGAWSMSDFQSRYFVVNSHVTDYRRVRQALIELETRMSSKKALERNMRKVSLEMKLHQEAYENEPHPIKKDLILVEIDDCEYQLNIYNKKLRVIQEEIDEFTGIVQSIVPDMAELETYKYHNEEKEREYWIARMGKQACMDVMSYGRIGQGNLDSIAMMPLKDQEETIKVAMQYSAVLTKAIGGIEQKVRLELENQQPGDQDKLLSSFLSPKLQLGQATADKQSEKISSEEI
jgi:hypothetical protein